MSSLSSRFEQLRLHNEQALITFVTAGDPPLERFHDVLNALCEGGADILEIGVPFSDPIADGPTIQASSQRALDRGVTPSAVLNRLADWRREEKPPIVLMTYFNPVLRMGIRTFALRAKEAGVDAVLLTDVTVEETGDWSQIASEVGLDTVFMIAPTSTEERIRLAVEAATGFVYAVSRTGVTGTESKAENQAADFAEKAKAHGNVPICVGFGISSPEDVLQFSGIADGVIVGSAIVKRLEQFQNGESSLQELQAFVRELKRATRTR